MQFWDLLFLFSVPFYSIPYAVGIHCMLYTRLERIVCALTKSIFHQKKKLKCCWKETVSTCCCFCASNQRWEFPIRIKRTGNKISYWTYLDIFNWIGIPQMKSIFKKIASSSVNICSQRVQKPCILMIS